MSSNEDPSQTSGFSAIWEIIHVGVYFGKGYFRVWRFMFGPPPALRTLGFFGEDAC